MRKIILTRIKAIMMCMAALLIMQLLFTKNVPVQAGVSTTVPITDYASQEDETEWNFLWVIPLQFQVTRPGEAEARQADAVTEDTVNDIRDYIVTNFDEMIYESSMHYMKPNSTIITIDVVNGSYEDASGDYIKPEDTLDAIKNGNITVVKGEFDKEHLEVFDHVATCFLCSNSDNTVEFKYGGLGGWRFAESHASYSLTLLSDNLGLSAEEKAYKENGYKETNGDLHCYYYTSLVVHEFMHGMEFSIMYEGPEAYKRNIPSPDGFTTYYGNVPGADLMNVFYRQFFRGAVPETKGSTSTFGLKKEDYLRAPHLFTEAVTDDQSVGTLEAWNAMALRAFYSGIADRVTITLTDSIDASGSELVGLDRFNGILNGNGYAIMNANLGSGALIGELADDGYVKFLLLVNVKVNAGDCDRIGGIVGQCSGIIESCGVTGTVRGNYIVGGICGALESGGAVINSFSSASVSCLNSFGGGICGYCAYGAAIDNCFNYGKVTSKDKSSEAVAQSGGGIVDNCYSLENVADKYSNCTKKTADEMAAEEFVTLLNRNYENSFKAGSRFPVIASAKIEMPDPADELPSGKLFTDANCKVAAGEQTVYVGGGKITQGDKIVNYKAVTLYTTIKVPNYQVTGSNGRTSTKKGKIIAGVTLTPDIPALSQNKFPKSAATDIAKASYNASKGIFTITAGKKAGTVYAWIISVSATDVIEEISCVAVNVIDTPAKIIIQDMPAEVATAAALKKKELAVSESLTVYLNPRNKSNEVADGVTYEGIVAAGTEEFLKIEKQSEYCYVITAKGLKNNKKTSAKATVSCIENKKKASVSISIINPVISMSVKEGSSETEELAIVTDGTANADRILNLTTLTVDSKTTTDKIKVGIMSSENGYTVNDKGSFKVTAKADSKLSVKYKDGVITVTAKKGVADNTKAYLVIYANNRGEGGIKIIPVTVSVSGGK